MADPLMTGEDSGNGFMGFLKGIPSALTPGPDAGRIGLAIWAASEGGPGGLMNALNSFKQEDAMRQEQVMQPEFQQLVKTLMSDGKTTMQEAVDQAAKFYPGAKGYQVKSLKTMQAQDAPLNAESKAAGLTAPSMPDRTRVDIPALPSVPLTTQLKYEAADAKYNAIHQGGIAGEVASAQAFGTPITPDLAKRIMDSGKEIVGQNPDWEHEIGVDKLGNFTIKASERNIVPGMVKTADGTMKPITAMPGYEHMDLLPTKFPGFYEAKPSKAWEAEQSALGSKRAVYQPLWQPGGMPGSTTPATEDGGKVSARYKPGMSAADMETEQKNLEGQQTTDRSSEAARAKAVQNYKIEIGKNAQMVSEIKARITDEALPVKNADDMYTPGKSWLPETVSNLLGNSLYQLSQAAKSTDPTHYQALDKLNKATDGLIGQLARTYGGEKGVLTEKDIDRMKRIFQLRDYTRDGANVAMDEVLDIVNSIAQRRLIEGWVPGEGDKLVGGDRVNELLKLGGDTGAEAPAAKAPSAAPVATKGSAVEEALKAKGFN